jgi:molybdenum cofactor guanylyltransferase
VKLAADLRQAILKEGMRRVEDFARRHGHEELAWPGGFRFFANINTPAELASAERLLHRSIRMR